MSFSFTPVAALALPVLLAATMPGAAPAKPAAQFEGKETLLRPEGYREWVFVGSSLGLRYEGGKKQPERLEYKNVYIDPAAYRAYKATGAFPQGTVLVLETAAGEEKKERGLRGSFQKEFTGLSAAVKDKGRFPDGWAYFSFSDGPGKTKDKARPAKKSTCYDCHREKGAEDNVFTQFYPVLKAARARTAAPSWQGKSVLLTRAGVQLQATDGEDIAPRAAGVARNLLFAVRKDEGDRLGVESRRQVGWAPKADAVPVAQAVAHFTTRVAPSSGSRRPSLRRRKGRRGSTASD